MDGSQPVCPRRALRTQGESPIDTALIVQFGLGGVGRAFLNQVIDTRDRLAARRGLHFRHVGLIDSRGLLWDDAGLDDTALRDALAAKHAGRSLDGLPGGEPAVDPVQALERLEARGIRAILVDLTAASGLEPVWTRALELGHAVVLANKRPLGAAWPLARPLFEARRLRFEATVGAGLPIIGTLRYLMETGDEVTAVEGALSGTMGYLCAEMEEGVPFSTALAGARELGYTEPDPREDLGGVDVARKALILARLLGWQLELDDVQVEGLCPPEWAALTIPRFMAASRDLDAPLAGRVEAARKRGETLRFTAEVRGGACRVGLRAVPRETLLGSLKGTDNVVVIHSRRYARPLTVCGAGAGVEVTAAGVLEDVLQLAAEGPRPAAKGARP